MMFLFYHSTVKCHCFTKQQFIKHYYKATTSILNSDYTFSIILDTWCDGTTHNWLLLYTSAWHDSWVMSAKNLKNKMFGPTQWPSKKQCVIFFSFFIFLWLCFFFFFFWGLFNLPPLEIFSHWVQPNIMLFKPYGKSTVLACHYKWCSLLHCYPDSIHFS